MRWDRCYLTLRVAAKVNREDSDTVVANPVKNLLCARLGTQGGSKRPQGLQSWGLQTYNVGDDKTKCRVKLGYL